MLRWSATRSEATSSSWMFIRSIRWRDGYAASSRHVAKLSRGGGAVKPTRLKPTGPTLTVIRTALTATTRAAA